MKIEKNLLSESLIAKLKAFTRDGKQPTQTNFFGYDKGVTGFSNAVFGFSLSEELKNEVAKELIAKKVFEKEPKDWKIFIHLFSRASFIPWHDDNTYAYTGTIYLNESWDKNLGGYFAYEDNDEIKCIVPIYNLGCFFKPPVMHSVTVTAGNAPLRESVQIFVKEF
jgi:Rps23 Pro-64 3,4-dihydroxylase Tpa1-like proline 4-hydroxylase